MTIPVLNYSPRFCDVCGEPKSELQGDKILTLRCTCDWLRGYYERLAKNVLPEFWKDHVFTIYDWHPPIFHEGGGGIFKDFIKIQKAHAIVNLFEFCPKILRRENGVKYFALDESIARGKTLFIRGPANSGRGTLMAQIKISCAGRDISTTPNPGDWSIFKSEVAQADQLGVMGLPFQMSVSEQYENVKVLALENLRGEGPAGTNRKQFRAASRIDAILTARSCRPGCSVFTTNEFIKEIGESMGDKLSDILLSPKTSLILLFDSEEADDLYVTLTCHIKRIRREIKEFNEKLLKRDSGKKVIHSELLEDEKALEAANNVFLMEYLFPNIPIGSSSIGLGETDTIKFSMDLDNNSSTPPKWAIQIRKEYTKFQEELTLNSLSFKQRRDRALINLVKESQALGPLMSDKELLETGRMMSEACQPLAEARKINEHAASVRNMYRNGE